MGRDPASDWRGGGGEAELAHVSLTCSALQANRENTHPLRTVFGLRGGALHLPACSSSSSTLAHRACLE